MLTHEWTRTHGQRFTYTIMYGEGEYFIERDGQLKKRFSHSVMAGIQSHEATPKLMLRSAIADIEALLGMDE